jgi:heterodisulfide reductase subunit B
MDFSYYPGCSLHSTASEYDDSAREVFAALGVELHELRDWNCCGASSAHSLDATLSVALPARNLLIAQQVGCDLVLPCAACFNRHKRADFEVRSDRELRSHIEDALGSSFTEPVAVRPLLDVVGNTIGKERVRARVTRPLRGLKVVSYYGCLLVRPPEITQFEDPEDPTLMNEILVALGADACIWSYTTDCCGGGLALTKSEVAVRLVDRLVERAREAGAEAIVTSCPMCQLNLETRQSGDGFKMPTFYFTELMGLAFGISAKERWWRKHLIDPVGLLQSLDLV